MATAQPFFQWSYVTGQWDQIWADLVQHVALSLLALGIGMVISIPLALLAWRFRIIRVKPGTPTPPPPRPETGRETGERALRLVEENRGALARTVEMARRTHPSQLQATRCCCC